MGSGLGRTVFCDVDLGLGANGIIMMRNLIMMRSLIALPRVMTLYVVALFRHSLDDGRGTRGQNCPTFDPRFQANLLGLGL